MKRYYCDTIEPVMHFLEGGDATLAQRICLGGLLPQAARFDALDDGELETTFGEMGTTECARYLCTLYLQDLSDYIRGTVTDLFEIVRYGEQLAVAVERFDRIEEALARPANAIEQLMCTLLDRHMEAVQPSIVGFTVPFPGCLTLALRCAAHLRQTHPQVRIAMGGGYPTTELRQMSDPGIFRYIDYLILDDGELPLERILSGGELLHTYTRDGYHAGSEGISHLQRGCPDFDGLPFKRYISLLEFNNPMHRLWSDGVWNKMMLAHGCYWAKCAFCDTSLDYIGRYDCVPATTFVDWMEQVARQTGSTGFHFVDEAAPPQRLRDVALEILHRGLRFTWWTNIRFEPYFTGDLCQLLAASGCIAVAGGLEVASDRLLTTMQKGITIHEAAMAARNLSQAGIMVHTYLMYGFPTQTLQETVDSLEVVRQLFRASWIHSGFWHRYAMTVHSPSGRQPELFGVRRRNDHINPFANNEICFVENRGYHIQQTGESLRMALSAYMRGDGLDRPVHKWFSGKAPSTTHEATLIADVQITPDRARLYNDRARVVWLGLPPERTAEGVAVTDLYGTKELKFKNDEADFLMELLPMASELSDTITFAEAAQLFTQHTHEPFVPFYLSKKWDVLRNYGLLQI